MSHMRYLHPLDFGWLIGLLEGEGTFIWDSSATVEVTMTDEDTIARAADLMETTYWRHHPPSSRDKGHKVLYRARLRSTRAVDLMLRLYPHMSQHRKRQIEAQLGRTFVPGMATDRALQVLLDAGVSQTETLVSV